MIPDTVTTIGKYAFAWFISVTSVTTPDSVTDIAESAFQGCTNLTSVKMSNSVSNIGNSAFEGCSNLTSVTIPDSVTSIGWYVFESCESLKDIYFAGTQQKWNQMLIYEDEAEGEMEIELGLDDNVTVHYNYVPTTLSITSHPANVTAKAGDSVSFSVKAEGEGLTYQWYYKKAGQTSFSAWNGRTHASETVTPNESWNGIQLYCIVKDASGYSVKSKVITFTVKPAAITITQQPKNVTVGVGEDVAFIVKASGTGLTYQWQYKKSGQTSWNNWGTRTTAFTVATANATWNGMQVRCVIKDSAGHSVTSSAAKITIQ